MISFTANATDPKMIGKYADGLNEEIAKGVLKAATIGGGAIQVAVTELARHQTGQLARSFLPAAFIQRSGGEISAGAISDLPYAAVQDRGGTIKAKRQWLAIPVTPEAKKRWPRDWGAGALAFAMTLGGQPLLLEPDTGRVHYLLRRQVKLDGLRYMDVATERSREPIKAAIQFNVHTHIEELSSE